MSRRSIEILTCDLCHRSSTDADEKSLDIKSRSVWVKHTDSSDGSFCDCEPYYVLDRLDVCKDCFNKIVVVADNGFRDHHDYHLISDKPDDPKGTTDTNGGDTNEDSEN